MCGIQCCRGALVDIAAEFCPRRYKPSLALRSRRVQFPRLLGVHQSFSEVLVLSQSAIFVGFKRRRIPRVNAGGAPAHRRRNTDWEGARKVKSRFECWGRRARESVATHLRRSTAGVSQNAALSPTSVETRRNSSFFLTPTRTLDAGKLRAAAMRPLTSRNDS